MRYDLEEAYIPGFEGRYVVSNTGYVRRCFGRKREPNYGTMNNRNDLVVHLTDNSGRSRMFSISRLVCEAFHANPEGRTQVDHIDTNRRNNRADNLRWVWPKENMANLKTACHRLEKPLPFKGGQGRKGCVAIFPDGSRIYKHTLREMAEALGCSPCTISRLVYGDQPLLRGRIRVEPWDHGEDGKIVFER